MRFLSQVLIALIVCGLGMIVTLNITKTPCNIYLGGWFTCCIIDIIYLFVYRKDYKNNE